MSEVEHATSKQQCTHESDLPVTQHESADPQSSLAGPVCPSYKPNHSPSERAHNNPIEFAGNIYGLEGNGAEGVLSLLFGLAMGRKAKTAEETFSALKTAVHTTEYDLRRLTLYKQAGLAAQIAPFLRGIGQLLNGNPVGWSAKTAAEKLMADETIELAARREFVSLLAKVDQAYKEYLAALAARRVK